MAADLVIHNARVLTLDPAQPEAEAVVIRNGRIAAVGPSSLAREWAPGAAESIDARGRRLIPGFIDSHLHLLGHGLNLERIRLGEVRSLAELQRLVAQRTAQAAPGEWILGGGWDEGLLGGLPTRQVLDQVAPRNPVFLSRHCYHVGAANTVALQKVGLWDTDRTIAGGVIDRQADGWPTGLVRENAKDHVDRQIPSLTPGEYRRILRRAAEDAAGHGLTSVHTNDGQGFSLAEVYTAYQELSAGPSPLPLRVWWDFAVDELEQAIALGWRTGLGTDWFKIGAVKVFADGSLGGRTAALRQPYEDDPGSRGLLLWETERLADRLALARQHGFQVAIHAIGDAALAQALEAHERALKASSTQEQRDPKAGQTDPASARLRLIHCQVTDPALWAKMRRLGVTAEVQPRFVSSDYPIIEQRVGRSRASTSYAWRSMARLGIPLAFSSDCPVEPINPMHAIYAAVTRQTLGGEPAGGWLPEERFSVLEALELHTRGGAYAVGEEAEKGRLAVGYLADMVLLEEDPLQVSPSDLKEIPVTLTVAGGRVVYENSQNR